MLNILSPIKNSFYSSGTIYPADITVELPENQEISRDKHRGISVFVFLIHFLSRRSSYGLVQTSIVYFWNLNLFRRVEISEFEMLLNIYINAYLTHMILHCYGFERDVRLFVGYFSFSSLTSLTSSMLVETQILTK